MRIMTKFFSAKTILPAVAVIGLAATALPSLASAQDCYQQRQDNRTNGAVLGAVAGGAIGGATSGHREKGFGTIAGAVLGAAVGSSIGADNTRCYDDRGYANNDRGYAYNDAPPPPPARVYYDAPPPPPPTVVYERPVYEPAPVVVYDYYGRPVYGHRHYWHRGW